MQWNDRIGRRIRLRDLHIVLAVTQAGGMAKAAQTMAVSHPVVSRTIAELERSLGVKLFDRTPQGIEPTIYGREVAEWAVTVFDDMRQGVRRLEFLQDPTQGELRVGTSSILMDGFIPEVIDRMTRKYPGIVFHADVALVDQLQGALRERKLDLIIVGLSAARGLDVEITPLFSNQVVVVAGDNNPLSRRRKLALADVINEPWLMTPDGNFGVVHIGEACRALGLPMPRLTVRTDAPILRNTLLATGRYVAGGTTSQLHFNGKRAGQKMLPIKLPIPPYSICAMTLRQRTSPPLAKLFIEEAKQVAKEMGKPFV